MNNTHAIFIAALMCHLVIKYNCIYIHKNKYKLEHLQNMQQFDELYIGNYYPHSLTLSQSWHILTFSKLKSGVVENLDLSSGNVHITELVTFFNVPKI